MVIYPYRRGTYKWVIQYGIASQQTGVTMGLFSLWPRSGTGCLRTGSGTENGVMAKCANTFGLLGFCWHKEL
jgi:hypothetical protein